MRFGQADVRHGQADGPGHLQVGVFDPLAVIGIALARKLGDPHFALVVAHDGLGARAADVPGTAQDVAVQALGLDALVDVGQQVGQRLQLADFGQAVGLAHVRRELPRAEEQRAHAHAPALEQDFVFGDAGAGVVHAHDVAPPGVGRRIEDRAQRFVAALGAEGGPGVDQRQVQRIQREGARIVHVGLDVGEFSEKMVLVRVVQRQDAGQHRLAADVDVDEQFALDRFVLSGRRHVQGRRL
ncbi:hypothetical protein D9M72_266830 [compost metagenome]